MHFGNRLLRITVIGLTSMIVLRSLPALAQEYHSPDCPGGSKCFRYGYVQARARVGAPVNKQVLVTSDVYSYCPLEINPDKIADDARSKVEQDLRFRYGNNFDLFSVFFLVDDTREKSEQYKEKEIRSAREHMHTGYLYVVYSGKCHT